MSGMDRFRRSVEESSDRVVKETRCGTGDHPRRMTVVRNPLTSQDPILKGTKATGNTDRLCWVLLCTAGTPGKERIFMFDRGKCEEMTYLS